MANKISGFVSRLVVGSEKSEDYARASLPSSRWSLFWDILKGRFGKLVIVNILVLLFFIPLFLLIVFKNMTISGYGTVAPFGQGFGMGYQAVESLNGFAEQMTLSINMHFYLSPRSLRQSVLRAVRTLFVIWFGRKVFSLQTIFGKA